MEVCSVYIECRKEQDAYKWILSEQAGRDLGEEAIRRWVAEHWNGYLRSKWLEHLQGFKFWSELDRGDFGLLQRAFKEKTELLNQILDRLKVGQENLDVLIWAQDQHLNPDEVIEILEALDINSRRLAPAA